MAKKSGWDVDFSQIDFSPNFSSIEEYESLMFLNELSEDDKKFWRTKKPYMEDIKNENK